MDMPSTGQEFKKHLLFQWLCGSLKIERKVLPPSFISFNGDHCDIQIKAVGVWERKEHDREVE